MRYLITLFVACVLTACATTDSKTSIKGPYVVVGIGKTEELARQDGFKKAVEMAMGVGIQSERVIQNDEITRKYLLTHSSGFVDKFNIVDVMKTTNNVEVIMEVYIKPTLDRKSTRLNSSHSQQSRMPSSA